MHRMGWDGMGWDGMVQGGEGTGGEEKTVRVSFGVWQRHQKRKERDVIKGNGGMERSREMKL